MSRRELLFLVGVLQRFDTTIERGVSVLERIDFRLLLGDLGFQRQQAEDDG
jgi:hypothetical protein